jgi:maltooligosyltrehalose trehalohydrolase
MHEFRVWAPRPKRVAAIVGGRRLPMRPAGGGWWACRAERAGPGSDYAFSLDGGPPRPDPRSAFQPQGVHGPSQVVDHTSFAWHDDSWRGLPLPGSVLYECHVGTFSAEGTFDGAIQHLRHVADLGADVVELLPVAEFAGQRGWGYDGVDLFAPHHAYGGPEGLKRFVDTAHAQGIGVVMDVVYNHFGPEGNYLTEFGPYFSEHQSQWGSPPVNFDGPGSDEVRRFVIDNALMWLRDYHCDGLRLDAVHAITDQSATHILEALAVEVDALAAHLGRPLFVIAESDLNDPRLIRSRDAGGYGIDASWADEWHHALHATLTGEATGDEGDYGPLAVLAKALRQAWVYDGTYSPYRQRIHGRPTTGLSGSQFVVSAQNHDQVGNRAFGERSGALMSEGRLRVAAALLLTSPFAPLLFQGEEWGASTPFQYFTDHQDPDLGRAVSEGRRRQLSAIGQDRTDVPDPQDPAVFERSRLDWTEPAEDHHAGLLAWHRRLIALRRQIPALTDPRLDRIKTEYDEEARWLIVFRGPVTVAVNLGTSPWTFEAGRETALLATSDPKIKRTRNGLLLPPDTAAILTGPRDAAVRP